MKTETLKKGDTVKIPMTLNRHTELVEWTITKENRKSFGVNGRMNHPKDGVVVMNRLLRKDTGELTR